jgi:hypothetical protein
MNEPMTIIEGLKKIKLLKQKHVSQITRIKNASCELDYEDRKFTYGTEDEQKTMVDGLLKSCSDIVSEIENISLRISKTNIETMVGIEIEGKTITKPISAWIMRRRELSAMSMKPFQALTDRNLKPSGYNVEGTDDLKVANPKRFYDQKSRDEKIVSLESEPVFIDGKLEVVNATTQLLHI